MAKIPPRKNLKNIDKDSIDPEILDKLDRISSPEILSIMRTQITKGPYPPPNMMAEYKNNCPEVYKQIVKGVEVQRAHRIGIEEKLVEHSTNLQRKSELNHSVLSYLAISVSALIIFAQLYVLKRVDDWTFPAILAILAIGGKPVATIIAELISKYSDKSKTNKNDPLDEE